jgi:hypothetical protein
MRRRIFLRVQREIFKFTARFHVVDRDRDEVNYKSHLHR